MLVCTQENVCTINSPPLILGVTPGSVKNLRVLVQNRHHKVQQWTQKFLNPIKFELRPSRRQFFHQFTCISTNTHIPTQENGNAMLAYRGHAAVEAYCIVVRQNCITCPVRLQGVVFKGER